MKKIGILGSGQMGSGIAQVFAMSGFEVLMLDALQPALDKGMSGIEKSLQKLESKEKLGGKKASDIMSQIKATLEIKELSSVDLVVEAVSENIDLKIKLFQQLDAICGTDTILASNTSSISLTQIAAATKRPDKVIGMHFFNPPVIMKLVEIIKGLATSEETFKATQDIAEKLGKQTVRSEEAPGFIVNRILMPMINEAVFVLQEGIATAEDIDKAMVLGTNQPMGPLTLADFIGLDTCLYILEVLHSQIGDPKFRPCPLLRKYVAAGYLGRKTGQGIYNYQK